MAKASHPLIPEGYSPLTLSEGAPEFIFAPTLLVSLLKAARRQEALAKLTEAAPPEARPTASPAKARARRRTTPGRSVRVVTFAALVHRRKFIDIRGRFVSEEKKVELKVIDDLMERGLRRVVGLRKDWRARIGRLRTEMPHLVRVIERIEACCALAEFTSQPLRIPPLLLIGPPGVGKTHFATRVADLLGVPNFVYALESAETTSTLTGSDKHWSNSEAGQLFKLIMQGEFANPVIVLDELDKANCGSQYRPSNALHAVLETSTSKQLRDKSFDLSFDASYVIYIATANQLSEVKPSLLSRFELFLIDEPGPRAAVAIARGIGPQLLGEMKLTTRFDPPTGEVIQQLALLGSPRQMRKVFAAAVGRAVVNGRTRVCIADLLGDATTNSQPHCSTGGRDEPVH